MRAWVREFLDTHILFRLDELESALANAAEVGEAVPTLRGLINYLRKEGKISTLRQKLFRVGAVNGYTNPIDPWLVVSKLEEKAVLSHRAALNWHLGRKAPAEIHFLSSKIAHPWPYQGYNYIPVERGVSDLGILEVSHGGHQLHVTSTERTLVDLLNRTDLDPDRLLTWNDLRNLTVSDEFQLQEYLKALKKRVINAKVAYFLDCLDPQHKVRANCLHRFGSIDLPLPRVAPKWDYYKKSPGWPSVMGWQPRSEWSLEVPDYLASQELATLEDSNDPVSRTFFTDKEDLEACLEEDLKRNFNFEHYLPGQRDLVEAVVQGLDKVGILPTGSGKSLGYLQPASLLNGPTIVISPLVSLIEDQVIEAERYNLKAFAMNRENRKVAESVVRRLLAENRLHLLFVPPESWRWLFRSLPTLHRKVRQIVVDEAHVMVEWGRTFRSAYRRLHEIREKCPGCPILALTATATPTMQMEIARTLRMKGIEPKAVSVRRENLFLKVQIAEVHPEISSLLRTKNWAAGNEEMIRNAISDARLLKLSLFLQRQVGARGIIYCERKKDVDRLVRELATLDPPIHARAYHGGQNSRDRSASLKAFKANEFPIMVATVAFGLGVNMANLHFVVHYGVPNSVDAYTQAIGRAGREGGVGNCLLIYVKGEERFLRRAILAGSRKGNTPARTLKRRLSQLNLVLNWIRSTQCRQKGLDAYFGVLESNPCKTSCDRCLPNHEGFSISQILKKEKPTKGFGEYFWTIQANEIEPEPVGPAP